MGFTASQKKDFISELQHYIYVISFHDKNIPHIIADGIYGNETMQAVKIFQKEYGLEPTGETDCDTWDRIVSVYKDYLRPEALEVITDDFILSERTPKEIIYIIQVLLKELCERFENIPKVDVNGVYSEEMEKSIRALARICGRSDDRFDAKVWNVLAREHNSFCKSLTGTSNKRAYKNLFS